MSFSSGVSSFLGFLVALAAGFLAALAAGFLAFVFVAGFLAFVFVAGFVFFFFSVAAAVFFALLPVGGAPFSGERIHVEVIRERAAAKGRALGRFAGLRGRRVVSLGTGARRAATLLIAVNIVYAAAWDMCLALFLDCVRVWHRGELASRKLSRWNINGWF